MILIADSGSTKTDWRLWNPDNNEVFAYSSAGLNPYFVNSKEIASVLNSTIPSHYIDSISHIYFYGSGCGSENSKKTVEIGIKTIYKNAHIEVNHDLTGAARALLGKETGLVCILGTGANAGYYNGNRIEEEAVSFGFMLGDEGSGNHLGKLLLKSIFSNKAPQEIRVDFKEQFPELDLSNLLRHLYYLPSPNRFLASFSPFILKHKKNTFIQQIVHNSFNQFIDVFVEDLIRKKDDKIVFQGSIAFYFQDEISQIFRTRGLNPVSFIDKPIDQLLKFHQNLMV